MISDFPHSLTLMQNSHTYVSDPYERSGGCKTLLHRYVLVSLQLTYNSMPECNFQTSAPARPRYTHETPGKGGQIQQKCAGSLACRNPPSQHAALVRFQTASPEFPLLPNYPTNTIIQRYLGRFANTQNPVFVS